MADNNWADKNWDDAARFYVQFAEEFPASELVPLTLLRVAEAYAAKGAWQDASRAYLRASIAGADPVACLAGQCAAAANLSDCGAAETAAQSLESRYPAHEETGEALFMAGNCYFAAGDDAKAVKLLLKVPILYPDSDSADDALLAVARARLRQGEPRQAENQLRVLLERYPASPLRAQAERLLVSVEGGGE
jgi:TolA-binding protein